MAKLENTIKQRNGYVEIICETSKYRHSVLVDKLSDIVSPVRISNKGYAYFTKEGGKSVSHHVMGHVSNMETVVDHIDGNRLDNRRENLRVVTQRENSTNKTRFVRNNTGVVGIAYRKNGRYEYYRVSLVDKSSVQERTYGGKVKRYSKKVTKQFNINKMGKEAAFNAAHKYLNDKKSQLGYI